MSSKAYERTENGTTTRVSVREALAEVNHAMMGGKRDVRRMSSGRGQHSINYKDGRTVRLVEVDAPAEEPAVAGMEVGELEALRDAGTVCSFQAWFGGPVGARGTVERVGAPANPDVVWVRTASGSLHTWDRHDMRRTA
ncbi:hypothetical protein [Streptomyces roseochromogenus]|uniref:Uncharacterized protein n=1 Tax=Streptomyces roseochromogenus subsp. oscitans DS 12.976 TaxID=1352936 RepID=V6JE06_STRRC|nr:hypothetical protein [Streptomyces roseochromogenus]EST18065.1 hypothetical protein M878_45720 [Streptomyces roseochromogenus subsp. oscitans DS 12.976]